MSQLPPPSPELVRTRVAQYDANEAYAVADSALSLVFARFPDNLFPEQVLLKVVALNSLYSTHVLAVRNLAAHIVALRIDSLLLAGATELVDKIGNVPIDGRIRSHYSFATKYCRWHRPEAYPVFDSCVERTLQAYRTRGFVASFATSALRRYESFRAVLGELRAGYGLEGFSVLDLDKFLWLEGKDLLRGRLTTA